MKDREYNVILTSDGSHTLFIPGLNETYHSRHGAIRESEHVFIENGLEFVIGSQGLNRLNILEVGFGTGLNALLTAEFCRKHKEVNIEYITIEPFPLPKKMIDQLNYCQVGGFDEGAWNRLHGPEWNSPIPILPNLLFRKDKTSIMEFTDIKPFHLVFFDAFAPARQPEMWEEDIFRKLYGIMSQHGVLTTYCAQGRFKRILKTLGFKVDSLPGPPGKKEMVRAVKV